MKRPKSLLIKATVVIGLLLSGSIMTTGAVCSDCSDGVKIPAFLAQGVKPNLLLMIDNSASMYDLAYIGNEGTCYDDTYSTSNPYVGYFDSAIWYAYNLTLERFEISDASQCSSTTYKATGDQVCVSINDNLVSKFIAKGNFLNWAASSKLDIEKKILTGGKYDSSSLIMESRGCLGRRYVKKIGLTNGQYLTLAIRPPESSEQAGNLQDDTTRIEIFKITSTGFNNVPCQNAINEMKTFSSSLGPLKGFTEDCMGYTNADRQFADAMNAFNHSIQNCWYLAKQGIWESGNGSVVSAKNDCEKVYESTPPLMIGTDDRAYVCSNSYVGECYDYSKGIWKSDSDECVLIALKNYCQMARVPEVLDPSDQVGITGDFWNIPAVLIDSGVLAQLAQPLLVLKGKIHVSTAPPGLIQEFAEDIRLGAMVFNNYGSKSECQQASEGKFEKGFLEEDGAGKTAASNRYDQSISITPLAP